MDFLSYAPTAARVSLKMSSYTDAQIKEILEWQKLYEDSLGRRSSVENELWQMAAKCPDPETAEKLRSMARRLGIPSEWFERQRNK